MRVLMDPARDTVDVGAHQGVYSWFFARHSRRVFAFEPNPENFRILSRLSGSITCYQAALSDEAKEAELRVPCDDAGLVLDEGGTIVGGEAKWAKRFQVKCMPLDAFELKDVGFLKIDVEGAEFAVLRGALRTITTSKPKMMVEINGDQTGEERLRETVAWIERLGYDCFFFSNRKIAAFRHFDLKRDQLRAQHERNIRDYANNFIFLPVP
jgi:FkbM family methyltransferase